MFEALFAAAVVSALLALLTVHESRLGSIPSSAVAGAAPPERREDDSLPIVSRYARCSCGHSLEGHPACVGLCSCARFEYAGGLIDPHLAAGQPEHLSA